MCRPLVIRHVQSPYSSSCSNEGIIASIIPLLCPTLSPDTVGSINQTRVSLVYKCESHMTGITPQLPNLVSMAAAFLMPGERS